MWPFRKNKQQPTSSRRVVEDPFLGDPQAKRLHQALSGRDWTTARDILSGPMSNDDRAFYMETAANVPGVQDWIEGAVHDEPGSVLPLLVQGAHAVFWAWEARGTGTGDTVGEQQAKVWFRRLKLAEDCLDEVVDRDPKCLEAWYFLIVLARARQLSTQERWHRYHKLIELDPIHHYGHDQMLQNLCAKWSGSAEEMFGFARRRAAAAPGPRCPPSSPPRTSSTAGRRRTTPPTWSSRRSSTKSPPRQSSPSGIPTTGQPLPRLTSGTGSLWRSAWLTGSRRQGAASI